MLIRFFIVFDEYFDNDSVDQLVVFIMIENWARILINIALAILNSYMIYRRFCIDKRLYKRDEIFINNKFDKNTIAKINFDKDDLWSELQ